MQRAQPHNHEFVEFVLAATAFSTIKYVRYGSYMYNVYLETLHIHTDE